MRPTEQKLPVTSCRETTNFILGSLPTASSYSIAITSESGPVQLDCAQDEEFRPDSRLRLAFLALMVLTFMIAMNSTALAIALPKIALELNGSALEAFWAGTSFLLTEAIFMAPLGRLSDVFGRVPVLNLSTGLFLIGTTIASVSNTFSVLIFGRAVQGVGGGGVAVCLEIVITDMVPLSVRGYYFSIISALWALGDVSGPILGGLLAAQVSWRWIFWINIPVAIIGLVLTNLFIRLTGVPGTFWNKAKRVDWGGMVISVAAFTALLIGVTWGGVLYSWDSVSTVLPIVMGLLGTFLFVAYERYIAPEPMIQFELLGNYNMFYALCTAFFHTVLVMGLVYMLPLYFEAVQQFGSLQGALAMIPYGITLAPFSAVAGMIISRTGNISWVIRFGHVMSISGCGMLILLGTKTKLWYCILALAWTGAGLGLLYTALVLLAQASMEERHAAFAVTVLNFFRHLGQAMGVAIVGVIFQNRMRDLLLGVPQLAAVADEWSRDAAALVEKLTAMEDGDSKLDVIGAYADSLKTVWTVMAAFCVLPLIGSFFLRRIDLKRDLETTQGLKGRETERPALN